MWGRHFLHFKLDWAVATLKEGHNHDGVRNAERGARLVVLRMASWGLRVGTLDPKSPREVVAQ
jgi:hypothetical protein